MSFQYSSLTPYLVFILGAMVGSFLNVCIYRLPRKESIVSPPSHCPSCHTQLKPRDNIPLLSYLLLGGRCRYCGESISLRYPLVEFMTGIVFLVLFSIFGFTARCSLYFYFSSILIAISFIDLEHQIIPNKIIYPGIVVGVVSSLLFENISFCNSLLGIIAGGLPLYLIALLSPKLFGREGMGGGDIKLAAMIGSFLGWSRVLLTLIIASFSGALVGILLIIFHIRRREDPLPFGPFIALGGFVSLLWGQGIIKWYLGLE